MSRLVNMTDMLNKALEEKYAVGQFNINNLEWTQAILQAAQEENSPVILGASEGAAKYMGGPKVVVAMVNALLESMDITVPVALHLDHGSSFESVKDAIDAGFSSVMIDNSALPIDENIANTKKVVDYAHANGVSVEAEVGTVGGEEDGVIGNVIYADAEECKRGYNYPCRGAGHERHEQGISLCHKSLRRYRYYTFPRRYRQEGGSYDRKFVPAHGICKRAEREKRSGDRHRFGL